MVLQIEKISFPDPYDRDTFSYFLRSEPGGFLVVHDGDGTILGYVIASSRYGYGLVMSIAVLPDQKRRGIGSMLMQAALNYLRSKVRQVYLQVSTTNAEAIAFYRKFSFHETGRISKYYPNGDDAVVMAIEF